MEQNLGESAESEAKPHDGEPAEQQPTQEVSDGTKEEAEEEKAKVEGHDAPSSDERQTGKPASS